MIPAISYQSYGRSNPLINISTFLCSYLKENGDLDLLPHVTVLISSASGMERGEVFDGPTDWLGSCDPMTPYNTRVAHRFGLDD
jgi:hypothetical protein